MECCLSGLWQVAETFGVLGYDVTAAVDTPGLTFSLSSSAPRPASLACTPGEGDAWCVAQSGAGGAVTFHGVPPGRYTVAPVLAGNNVNVNPASATVTVGHGSATVEPAFQLAGFTVGGKVMDAKGEGMAGVAVWMDGVQVATTGAKGSYSITATSGPHTITAKAKHAR